MDSSRWVGDFATQVYQNLMKNVQVMDNVVQRRSNLAQIFPCVLPKRCPISVAQFYCAAYLVQQTSLYHQWKFEVKLKRMKNGDFTAYFSLKSCTHVTKYSLITWLFVHYLGFQEELHTYNITVFRPFCFKFSLMVQTGLLNRIRSTRKLYNWNLAPF